MYALLFFCLFLLLILHDYLRKRHRIILMSRTNIKGQSPLLPFIGNAFMLIGTNSENIFEFHKKLLSNKQKAFYIWNFNRLQVVSANVEDIECLLSSQTIIEKHRRFSEVLSQWLGYGLLLSSGKKWHQRRKIITPTFHFKILEQFVEIFDRQGSILAKKLYKYADGKTVLDVYPLVALSTLDIIAETAMGVSVGAQLEDTENLGYSNAVKEASQLIFDRARSPILVHDFFYRLLQPNKNKLLNDYIKYMNSYTKDIITKRRNILEKEMNANKQSNVQENDSENIGTKKRAALLDVLLQTTVNGEPLSDEDIREEVETFMFEGHDTTASGISFALYVIARHPEVQKRLFEEIRSVIGDDKEQPVTLRDLHELKYLDAVIKESLRLFPPVPMIGRRFPSDSEINGQIFPADTIYSIPIYCILHDPDYFENPYDFNPERFASDNDHHIKTFANIPFSAGPRNCIGQKFAILEMKSEISKILRHFELIPLGPEVILSSSITLKSKNGINLGLKPRVYK